MEARPAAYGPASEQQYNQKVAILAADIAALVKRLSAGATVAALAAESWRQRRHLFIWPSARTIAGMSANSPCGGTENARLSRAAGKISSPATRRHTRRRFRACSANAGSRSTWWAASMVRCLTGQARNPPSCCRTISRSNGRAAPVYRVLSGFEKARAPSIRCSNDSLKTYSGNADTQFGADLTVTASTFESLKETTRAAFAKTRSI